MPFTDHDERIMRRALLLARAGAGYVSPNPLVGCIITNPNGDVLGEGAHLAFGGPHAEPNAIHNVESKGHTLRGATAFVTLEPHAHVGKTPPCTTLLIDKGIARCVIAMEDPNPKVSGAGNRELRKAGIEVEIGLLEKEARELNRFFIKHITTGLPYVTMKLASTLDGRPTTLGRGGSDFSASILAAALDAEELWIWMDVDGIMTADPRLVPDARVLDEITYAEAAELAYAGAKVLHPRTLAPLVERGIPVWSKNSFAPEKPGTRIVPKIQAEGGPHAVTSMKEVALVSIEPIGATISGARLMAEALHALDAADVELLAITSSSYRQNFCFLIKLSELDRALKQLQAEFAIELAHGYVKAPEVDTEVGLLAVVGEGMRGTPGLAGRIFTAISRDNINIIAIAQGSSELTIAIAVRRSGLENAVRAVHKECGLAG